MKLTLVWAILWCFAIHFYAEDTMTLPTPKPLTLDERFVILDKGTERAFTGKFYQHNAAGVYTCRQCGAALYRSNDKFASNCGWPAFDDAIAGAVKQVPDEDGHRTEILCNHCGGHLGHVFTGEKLTAKNTRYCVNSLSMDFVPAAEFDRYFKHAIVAGGCFWGVEYYFDKTPGVISAVSGYTGGTTVNPTYEEVCTGKTGHVEAVDILYDPRTTSYENILKLFFEIHDPAQADGQGPDLGPQYLSKVFYFNEEERQTAEKLIALLRQKHIAAATALAPAGPFYPAEAYHQNYYLRNRKTPYCHIRVKRFD